MGTRIGLVVVAMSAAWVAALAGTAQAIPTCAEDATAAGCGIVFPTTASLTCDTTNAGASRITASGDIEYCDAGGQLRTVGRDTCAEPPCIDNPVCANGVREENEPCDTPGSTSECLDGGTCSSTCACENGDTCGDSTVGPTEECEADEDCTGTETCDAACHCITTPTTAECGDGTIDPGEQCDVGGKTCATDADCGSEQATCTASACPVALGSCTDGCMVDCKSCVTPTDVCDGAYGFVRTDGSDAPDVCSGLVDADASATPDCAKATITAGLGVIAAAENQNILCVRDGVYRESVTIPASGNASYPLTIAGSSDAIIDPATQQDSGWVDDSANSVWNGEKVYRKQITPVPSHLWWSNKQVAGALYKNADGSEDVSRRRTDVRTGPSTALDPWAAGAVKVSDWTVTPLDWTTINGVTYVHFQDDRDVNTAGIQTLPWVNTVSSNRTISTGINTNDKDYITIKGITIRNAAVGIYGYGGSTNITITDTSIRGCYTGIRVDKNVDSDTWTITHNLITHEYALKAGLTHAADDTNHWRVWTWIRNRGGPDSGIACGLFVEADTDGFQKDLVFSDNALLDLYHGIRVQSGAAPYSAAQSSWGRYGPLTLARNRIERISNDGITVGVGERPLVTNGIDIVRNTILRANNALRLGGLRTGTAPVTIHENLVWSPITTNSSPDLVYFYHRIDAPVFIYHNSMSGRSCVSQSGGADPADYGLIHNGVWFVNNICSTQYRFYTDAPTGQMPLLDGTHIDYNWFRTVNDAGLTRMVSGSLGGNNQHSPTASYAWSTATEPSWNPPATTGTGWPRGNADDVRSSPPTEQASYTWALDATLQASRGYDATPDIGGLQYLAPGPTTTITTTTLAGSTTTTTIVAPDWSGEMDMNFRLENGALDADDGGGGCTWEGTDPLTSDTTTYIEGAGSGIVDANAENFHTTDANGCSALEYAGSFVCGLYYRPAAVPTQTDLMGNRAISGNTGGVAVGRSTSGGYPQVLLYGTAASCRARATTATAAIGSWSHIASAWDASGGALSLYHDGAAVNVDCLFNACTNDGATNVAACTMSAVDMNTDTSFDIGGTPATHSAYGNYDDAFCDDWTQAVTADDGKVDPESLCRICACRVSGEDCTCNGDGTTYADTGRWSECGSCTLPDCNDATP